MVVPAHPESRSAAPDARPISRPRLAFPPRSRAKLSRGSFIRVSGSSALGTEAGAILTWDHGPRDRARRAAAEVHARRGVRAVELRPDRLLADGGHGLALLVGAAADQRPEAGVPDEPSGG